jgi:hypothetical protein
MNGTAYDPENPTKTPTPVILKDSLQRKIGRHIVQGHWDDALEQVQEEFFGIYVNGQPQNLFYASQLVETVLAQVNKFPEWRAFRDWFQIVTERSAGIQNMICLGLGVFFPSPRIDNTYIVQYAVFVYMWQVMNEKRRKECKEQKIAFSPVKRYFQDPAFDLRTKYLLQRIPRNTDPEDNIVLEHPEAMKMIDSHAFVYAMHLPARSSVHVLSLGAQIYIGNSSSKLVGSWTRAMMETFIEESLFTNTLDPTADFGPEMHKLLAKVEVCERMYDEKQLSESLVPSRKFGSTSIYRLQRI